jgi:hypothetical protein
MRFGFDIDGTITAAPAAFAAIMRALRRDGHEVHVVTGQTDPITTEDTTARLRQLEKLGIGTDCYERIHLSGPPDWVSDKADYCREQGLDLVFENDVAYGRAIAAVGCPVTIMLA